MPRALGRHAEVLLPRGGLNSSGPWIEGCRSHTRFHPPLRQVYSINRVPRLRVPDHFWSIWSINLRTLHAVFRHEITVADRFQFICLAVDLRSIIDTRFSDQTPSAVEK